MHSSADSEAVVEERIPNRTAWLPFAHGSVSVGRFVGFDDQDRFLVEDEGPGSCPLPAVSCIALDARDVGVSVVVALETGGQLRCVILGRLHERKGQGASPSPTGLRVDGDKVVIEAEREIELRCGEASLVLTRAGKVLIKGSYVLSRSRGANRIKGAFVDIN